MDKNEINQKIKEVARKLNLDFASDENKILKKNVALNTIRKLLKELNIEFDTISLGETFYSQFKRD